MTTWATDPVDVRAMDDEALESRAERLQTSIEAYDIQAQRMQSDADRVKGYRDDAIKLRKVATAELERRKRQRAFEQET